MDPFAGPEGCGSEHPRRPFTCSPFERVRPVLPDRPFTRWSLRDLPDLVRFLTARRYSPR